MSALAWVACGVGATLLGVVAWLVWPWAGLGFLWQSAPDGALKYRIRRESVLPQLLGSDACCLFNVVHVAAPTLSGYLHAHELAHALQARRMGGWLTFLWRYLTRPATHVRLEDEAHQFGLAEKDNVTLATHRRFARVR